MSMRNVTKTVKNMFSTLNKQFCVVSLILFIVNFVFLRYSFIGRMVSLIGSSLILLTVSWKLSKYLYRYRSGKKLISSHRKAVLITGCDRGFGNLLAQRLNKEGFVVYATVLDLESDGSKQLPTFARFPESMKLIKMDVTSDEEVLEAYEFVRTDLKLEDIELWGLVNVAGTLVLAPLDWGTIDSYRKVFDVNTLGMVRVTRTFLPFIRQSKGRIINIASTAGTHTPALSGHYAMSKHAVVSFSDALRREMSCWHVNVSTVSPCTFMTQLTSAENLAQVWENEWKTTSEDVKDIYGQQYYEAVKDSFKAIRTGNVCHNLELVINALVDALRSDCPQAVYNVNGTVKWHLIMFLNDYLPIEWMDQYLRK